MPDRLVEVRLPINESMQQVVTLRPAGDTWALVQVGASIE
jgi:hypothetical protein